MNTSKTINPIRRHRRDVWLKIIAPVMLPFIGLIVFCAILVIAVINNTLVREQVTVIMSLSSLCIMLPLAVLCLIPYFLLAVMAYLGGWSYAHARTALRAASQLTEQAAAKTTQYLPKLARPVMALNVRLAQWEHTLQHWQQSASSDEGETNHE